MQYFFRRDAGAAVAVILCTIAASATAADYRPVTDERLANPEPENWLRCRGNYRAGATARSTRSQADNVKELVPVWRYSTGVIEGHQAPPIVNNGMMFVTTPQNQVIALDAKTGDRALALRAELPEDLFQLHPDQPRRRRSMATRSTGDAGRLRRGARGADRRPRSGKAASATDATATT